MNENGPVIPSHMIDATLVAGAKKQRDGSLAKSSVFSDGDAELIYDGPRIPQEMYEDGRFNFSCIVRVQAARVERTRPIFKNWTATISLSYDDSTVELDQITTWLNAAGTYAGFGDWRPKYGRFTSQLIG